ncbi:hypothetical protein BaRGS_00024403 [Batillaria attramentaria]|uniref:Uncharacterized protein n=1 Tax=Batillaria attramentaria TaxID=370345 RepID=A0ABD0KBB4_9CAEN
MQAQGHTDRGSRVTQGEGDIMKGPRETIKALGSRGRCADKPRDNRGAQVGFLKRLVNYALWTSVHPTPFESLTHKKRPLHIRAEARLLHEPMFG